MTDFNVDFSVQLHFATKMLLIIIYFLLEEFDCFSRNVFSFFFFFKMNRCICIYKENTKPFGY